ncbi:Ribosomal RNA small subunit methyltransferase A [Candidatus Portiera aleyrodidarum]|uniref:Ribosomal RNA small subunit methyltransferase A n=1 Tax=Candidatus Portiera aleyrodidarum TV TaxID=1297582 RepID=A0A8D3X846_9GAMM|nr:16S rRNA (adenine(1518)-N(6)/adenine(1519)-N(6))-dimethyltransferase RsmA [Candidatus Portiera aleyrodidarum]AGI27149.1 dimethyladenosine transferase [Candidatus Portiera aleyrodidarum TV]CEI59124.1 Ribosomal RNA small subunit methyltransferase A [Candidatus Portiera aleyrodidarum]
MLKIKIKKELGQNFIIKKGIIKNIIKIINIKTYEHILEIGSGIGLITQKLLDITKNKIYSIEIDNDLIKMLFNKFYFYSNYIFLKKDILKSDLSKIKKLRVIGNLPYNISVKILLKLIKYKKNIKDMHLMFQKEVAMRLSAKKGEKSWGSLTVIIQYFCKVFKLFDLSSENFIPKPKVISTMIKLIPYKKISCLRVKDKKTFFYIVKKSFSNKRQTIQKNLKGLRNSLNISPKRRAKTLTIKEFVKITNTRSLLK